MTQDVQQWLTEIQSLQQRLADVSQERASAYEQLARWQQSYQTEAQQRRKDIQRLQTVIYRLDQENKRLKQQLALPPDARSPFFMSNDNTDLSNTSGSEKAFPSSGSADPQLEDNVGDTRISEALTAPSQTSQFPNQLQKRLKEMVTECDRLSKALSQEQSDHEQTRQTLMTALGDTVEQLERERQRYAVSSSQRQPGQSTTPQPTPEITAQHTESNRPLPGNEQKQLTPAPPPPPDGKDT